MANKGRKYCAAYPCNNLVPVGETYCEKHKPPAPARRDVDSFYRSNAWKRASLAYRRANPYCERCLSEGRRTRAQLVHHKMEIKDGGSRLDPKNMESLCHACHNQVHKSTKRPSKNIDAGSTR